MDGTSVGPSPSSAGAGPPQWSALWWALKLASTSPRLPCSLEVQGTCFTLRASILMLDVAMAETSLTRAVGWHPTPKGRRGPNRSRVDHPEEMDDSGAETPAVDYSCLFDVP